MNGFRKNNGGFGMSDEMENCIARFLVAMCGVKEEISGELAHDLIWHLHDCEWQIIDIHDYSQGDRKMNWPALWKEVRIDPESEKGKSIKRKILRLLDSDNILPLDFLVLDIAMTTGLSWPRIQEILRNE
jgi:hypothetical protein